VPKKRIFISPLHWGLGHATRVVPIISELIKQDIEPIIGADGVTAQFLNNIFPDLQLISMPHYKVHYKYDNMVLNIALQLPQLLKVIKNERILTAQLVRDLNIDGIISDNRYGLAHNGTPSVFIGHQLNIKIPNQLICRAVNFQNRKLLAEFTNIWVPDINGPDNLSGELSSGFNHPGLRYIGPISRLDSITKAESEFKIVALLSGPEPQRSYFEKSLILQLRKLDVPSLLIRGILKKGEEEQDNMLRIKNFADATEIASRIKSAELFIARSGYSTMMDLAKIGSKHILLVPTPGQTEQEYLAKRFSKKGAALYQEQHKLDIKFAWDNRKKSSGLSIENNDTTMKMAVSDFIDSLK